MWAISDVDSLDWPVVSSQLWALSPAYSLDGVLWVVSEQPGESGRAWRLWWRERPETAALEARRWRLRLLAQDTDTSPTCKFKIYFIYLLLEFQHSITLLIFEKACIAIRQLTHWIIPAYSTITFYQPPQASEKEPLIHSNLSRALAI